MELINNWKEKFRIKREKEIKRAAEECITLSDFNGKMYIAFQGNPLIAINGYSSASDVLSQLQEVRDNYVSSKMNN